MNFGYLFAAKALAYPMIPAMAWWGWLLVVLGIILVILIILGFIGSKLQKKQALQREQLEQMAQTMSMIVIDKKKLKLTDQIKSFGKFDIPVKLYTGISGTIHLVVTEDK